VETGVVFDSRQKRFVLMAVLHANVTTMRSQVLTWAIRIGRVPGNGVELMVAHDGQRAAGIHHAPDNPHAVQLPGPAVDEVTHEDGGARGVLVGTIPQTVSEMVQQALQLVPLAMNVTHKVVRHKLISRS
jgi:hypothetical protein